MSRICLSGYLRRGRTRLAGIPSCSSDTSTTSGWSATDNAIRAAPIWPAYLAFRAIYLAAGRHTVAFHLSARRLRSRAAWLSGPGAPPRTLALSSRNVPVHSPDADHVTARLAGVAANGLDTTAAGDCPDLAAHRSGPSGEAGGESSDGGGASTPSPSAAPGRAAKEHRALTSARTGRRDQRKSSRPRSCRWRRRPRGTVHSLSRRDNRVDQRPGSDLDRLVRRGVRQGDLDHVAVPLLDVLVARDGDRVDRPALGA